MHKSTSYAEAVKEGSKRKNEGKEILSEDVNIAFDCSTALIIEKVSWLGLGRN